MGGIRALPGQNPSQWLYVMGIIAPDDSFCRLKFEVVESSDDLTGRQPGKEFTLAALGPSGQVIASCGFDLELPHDGEGKSSRPFTAFLPFDASTAAVTLSAPGKE